MATRKRTLRDLLDSAGYTLEALAERAGISERTIRLCRDGYVRVPRSQTVHGLSTALNVPTEVVRDAISASSYWRE